MQYVAHWEFDILRQGGVDWWILVCIVAALVLVARIFIERWWTGRSAWWMLPAAIAGIVATAAVLAIPLLHRPAVGMVWTFVMVALVSTLSYLRQLAITGLRHTAILLSLRLLALVLLVPMLFEPVVRYIATTRPDRPLFVVVDSSGSMSVPDLQNGPTRIQSVWAALQPQLDKIQKTFAARFFAFDSTCRELPSSGAISSITADGKSTDIVKALSTVLGQTDRSDAAVILISDGIDNTSGDVLSAVAASRRPIHTVWVGSEEAQASSIANIAVDSIKADDEMSVGHVAKLGVVIKSTGLASRVVEVKLAQVDSAGKPVGEITSKRLVLEPLPQGQVVEMEYKPATLGVQHLAAWIDPVPGERSTVDNRQELQALALDPRIKVLYIEGRARPEYRDLNRALQRDANIEAASLLRLQQDKFSASGSVDGQPFKALPASDDQWRKFDVIILGDLDASFFTKSQQDAIERRVSEGGGLLMMGGQSSFGPGSFAGTPIEKALPVFVGGTDAAQEKTEFVPRLTAEGASHPAMEGLTEWFGQGDKPGQKQLPPIRGNVVIPKTRTGATTVLVHQERPGPDGKPQVVLALQQYGKGRSGAFTADTTYLWYLPLRGMGQDSPYNRFWGQVLRWLAGADVRNRQRGAGMEALISKTVYELGDSITLKAMVRDEKGDATRFANVAVKLQQDGKPSPSSKDRSLTPSDSYTGMYHLDLSGLGQGEWTAQMIASKDGKEIGRQTVKFTLIAPADELLQLASRPQLLAEISRRTSGYHYPLAQLPALINQLVRSDPASAQTHQVVVPLSNIFRIIPAILGHPPHWAGKYDLPMQAALVFLLLAGEWALRRQWQLP